MDVCVCVSKVPVGPLLSGQGAHPSPGAGIGGLPGLLGAPGHSDRLLPRLHIGPVSHTAGRPSGTPGDTETIRK